MQKILLAIDGSEESEKAVSEVAKVAGPLDAEVTVLTVIKEIKISSAPSGPQTTPSQGSTPSSRGSIPSSGTPLQGSRPSQGAIPSQRQVNRMKEKTRLENEGESILNQAEALMQEEEIKTEKIMLEGNVADNICRFAEEQAFDLIVLADKGEGGIARFLLGSTSEKVLRHAPTSVLVVK